MDAAIRYSLIVPTFNEIAVIDALLNALEPIGHALSGELEVLIVDDNSPDGTASRASAYAPQNYQLRVLVRKTEPGLAKAVLHGFEQAQGAYLAVMDADLSHPPEVVPALFAALTEDEQVQMAVGTRYSDGGEIGQWPWYRRCMSGFATLCARPVTRLSDPMSGLFALKRDAYSQHAVVPRGYKIALEYAARLAHDAVAEVPFHFKDRFAGESKLGMSVVIAYLLQLFSLYRVRYATIVGFFQFALVGALGVVVDIFAFNILYWYLGLNYLGAQWGGGIAQVGSFLVAVYGNYLLNRAWTFKDRDKNTNVLGYIAVCAVGLVLRTIIYQLLVRDGGGEDMLWWQAEQGALLVGIVAASVWNYIGSSRFVFTGKSAPGYLSNPASLREGVGIGLIFALIVFNSLFWALITPLSMDEAYYWQWSEHLDWGYFDHAPMIAYLIAAGTRLLGDTQLGVRLLPVCMSALAALAVGRLSMRLWQLPGAGTWAMAPFLVVPLFALGGMLATPDLPLVGFWAVSLWGFERALRQPERRRWWLLCGTFIGFGIASKYTMVLLPIALLLAMLTQAQTRALLCQPRPWLALIPMFLVCLPMLLWNYQRNFEPMLYQWQHGTDAADAAGLAGLGTWVMGQMSVITPWLALPLLWLFLRRPAAALPAISGKHMARPLQFATLVPFAVFALAALSSPGEANWPAPAWITICISAGAVAYAAQFWRHILLGLYVATSVLVLWIHVESVYPLTTLGRQGHMAELGGYGQTADELSAWAAEKGVHDVLAPSYQLASILQFEAGDALRLSAPFEQGSGSSYLQWWQAAPAQGAALFVAHQHTPSLNWPLPEAQWLGAIPRLRGGVAMTPLQVWYLPRLPTYLVSPEP